MHNQYHDISSNNLNFVFKREIEKGERFSFGKNWETFLTNLSPEQIYQAELSLKTMLENESLEGKTFLDVGSGSGLFSLAARRLGAKVTSFDYDPDSVACTNFLKDNFFSGDMDWKIESGSILDENYINSLGQYDIVYSWGVLHHTGAMVEAFSLISHLIKPNGGKLFIGIYNDQGWRSQVWLWIKKIYNKSPFIVKPIILFFAAIRLWGPTNLKDIFLFKPFETWKNYTKNRGMSPWSDIVDWIGGYPFEFAKPEVIFDFFKKRGFVLLKLTTTGGGLGINQFVFSLESDLKKLPSLKRSE